MNHSLPGGRAKYFSFFPPPLSLLTPSLYREDGEWTQTKVAAYEHIIAISEAKLPEVCAGAGYVKKRRREYGARGSAGFKGG